MRQTYFSRSGDAQEVDKANVLVANDLDLVDQTKATEIVAEHFLGDILVETAEINVPARIALLDCECHCARDSRRLAPADLELLTVQRELLDERIRVERGSGGSVQEGQENA